MSGLSQGHHDYHKYGEDFPTQTVNPIGFVRPPLA